MMVAIDHLRELARQSRRVRMMCPCSTAYERAKADWLLAEQAAFAYLASLDMEAGKAPDVGHYFESRDDAEKGGGI